MLLLSLIYHCLLKIFLICYVLLNEHTVQEQTQILFVSDSVDIIEYEPSTHFLASRHQLLCPIIYLRWMDVGNDLMSFIQVSSHIMCIGTMQLIGERHITLGW